MLDKPTDTNGHPWRKLGLILFVALVIGGTALTFPLLKQQVLQWQTVSTTSETDPHADHAHDHAGHDHSGHDHAEGQSLELSKQAQESIGLKVAKVKLSDYENSVTIPGIVEEIPGRSQLQITAPLTGVITKILLAAGQAVKPGDELFEIRLTHEELVQSQAQLLATVEQIDVIQSEIKRLEEVTKDGTVAAKTLRERQYELQKEEASLRAQKQALLLHHLSAEQIEAIVRSRVLLQAMTVRVPTAEEIRMGIATHATLLVQDIKVERGQQVNIGDPLSILVDHSELVIAGEAFEQDSAALAKAKSQNRPISAVLENKAGSASLVEGLKIRYLENRIDAASRTQHFYVTLPNQLQGMQETPQSGEYVQWLYKPGQRMQLRVPVERMIDRIVLPVEAVSQDGIDHYVFQAEEGHFDRRAVRVEYRDALYVVIANDGSVKVGAPIAMNAAQQLQLALKNKAGGGIDPHAGHSH
jgi:membrane fusion protein, heavy metal efflux system